MILPPLSLQPIDSQHPYTSTHAPCNEVAGLRAGVDEQDRPIALVGVVADEAARLVAREAQDLGVRVLDAGGAGPLPAALVRPAGVRCCVHLRQVPGHRFVVGGQGRRRTLVVDVLCVIE